MGVQREAKGGDPLSALADAILDGSAVDWSAVEAGADEATRGLLHELKLVAALADVHRSAPPSTITRSESARAARAAASDDVERWGHLQLFERVGRGTSGDVYRAWDTRLDREVALKLLPAARPAAGRPSPIIEEGRLLARVDHPNVVHIYGAEQIGDRIGLWMEFVRGETIERAIARDGRFGVADSLRIALELSRAVAAVHAAGLLHRDIKAQNVLRSSSGRIVLMDFGAGRELSNRSATDLTGTPLYLAPEILRGEPASVQSDVYSVGVLIHRMLSGGYPVHAGSVAALREAHERGARRPLRAARRDLSTPLARAIDKATNPDPARRQRTVDALASDLAAASQPWRRWPVLVVVTACAALLATSASDAALYVAARPALKAGSQLLVADFVPASAGSAADRDLASTIQQIIAGAVEASPHLAMVPPARVRAALAGLQRQATDAIDEALGLEIARREGLGAVVTGSIDTAGDVRIIHLRVLDPKTGAVLAEPVEGRRGGSDEALHAAFSVARRLRLDLGEPLESVQAIGTGPSQPTTIAYAARREYALGKRFYDRERTEEALTHFLAAVEWDANFALAHVYAALAYGSLGDYKTQREHLDRASAIASDPQSGVSQADRHKILADRDIHVERFHEAAAHFRNLLVLRPGDGAVLANLGLVYGSLRQYPEAIEALEAATISFDHDRVWWMLADMYGAVGRTPDALRILRERLTRERPASRYDWLMYARLLMLEDAGRDAIDAALGEAETRYHLTPAWGEFALAKADALRARGRYQDAQSTLQQGLDRGNRGGVEALQLSMAALLLDAGRPLEAASLLRTIDVQLARRRVVQGVFAARAGDVARASEVLRLIAADAGLHNAPRPMARMHQLRAEIALADGQVKQAHQYASLAVRQYSTAWILETLARAQEAAGLLPEAIETWVAITKRPGERAIDWDAPAYAQTVLAHYRLALLLERAGRVDEARARYDEFLRRWEGADATLPALVDARERRRRLGQGAQSTPAGRVPKPAA
jgi:tetratricopeptide (TPR) repeat protein